MKRKIQDMADAADKTKTVAVAAGKEFSFTDLALDPRLIQAVAEQKFSQPTLVQRMAIPIALKGQDVLCKAKTGSGKTAAYVLPVLAGILKRKTVRFWQSPVTHGWRVLTVSDRPRTRHDRPYPRPDPRTCRSGFQSH